MAITINGTGTITGVSTGGLPDGIVDADTLATDSVTAAKLASDAIQRTDLPPGSLLAVHKSGRTGSHQNTQHNTTTFTTVADGTIQLTPISQTSRMIVCMTMNLWGDVDGDGQTSVTGQFRITATIGGTANTIYDSTNTVIARGGHNRMQQMCIQVDHDHNTTDEITYTMQARRTASDRALNSGSGTGNHFLVFEVEAS
jgi:hypothetical protein